MQLISKRYDEAVLQGPVIFQYWVLAIDLGDRSEHPTYSVQPWRLVETGAQPSYDRLSCLSNVK